MLATLDLNTRSWLVEHFGLMRSSKRLFLYCESILDDLIIQPHEHQPMSSYSPGCLVAIDKEASKRTIEIPDFVLEGLADLMFNDPIFSNRPADRLTVYMVEVLGLQNVH